MNGQAQTVSLELVEVYLTLWSQELDRGFGPLFIKREIYEIPIIPE